MASTTHASRCARLLGLIKRGGKWALEASGKDQVNENGEGTLNAANGVDYTPITELA